MLGLVVGVSRYKSLPALGYGESDARRVADVLQHMGVTVTTLLNPTRLQIADQIANALGKLGPEDSFHLYFSGHGWADSGMTYLGGADASIQADRLVGGFSLDSLKVAILEAHLKSAFAFLDVCQSSGELMR